MCSPSGCFGLFLLRLLLNSGQSCNSSSSEAATLLALFLPRAQTVSSGRCLRRLRCRMEMAAQYVVIFLLAGTLSLVAAPRDVYSYFSLRARLEPLL